jgi:hypothetical protein
VRLAGGRGWGGWGDLLGGEAGRGVLVERRRSPRPAEVGARVASGGQELSPTLKLPGAGRDQGGGLSGRRSIFRRSICEKGGLAASLFEEFD